MGFFMRKPVRCIAIVLGGAMLAGPTAAAQFDVKTALEAVASASSALRPVVTNVSTAEDDIAAIDTATEALHERAVAGATASSEYIDTLREDAVSLKAAMKLDGAQRNAAIANIRKDLEAKVVHAGAGLGATNSFGNDVLVHFRTLDNGKEKKGYYVRANPIGNPERTPPKFIFTKMTPIDDAVVPAGVYMFWVERNAKHGRKQLGQIGNVRAPDQTVDLEADVP